VVGLDAVVAVLLAMVPRRREQFAEQLRVHRCPVGDHLSRWRTGGGDRLFEERLCCGDVPLRRHVDVDDLLVLVHRPMDVAPNAADLDVCLIDIPAAADWAAAQPRSLSQQRGEAVHPPVDAHVVHLDTAFGEQLLHVPVGQPEPQIPADRQRDHLRRKPEPPNASQPSRPPSTAPVLSTYSSIRPAPCVNPVIQSISWLGPATNPSNDIMKCQSTFPLAVWDG